VRGLPSFYERDRREVEALLSHPHGLHLYLTSRIGSEGDGFVFRRDDRLAGVAWFGRGRNLIFSGDDPQFLSRLATLARERQADWLMTVGPWTDVTGFLERYLPIARRRPRLDRAQDFFVQEPSTLAPLREERLERAGEEDLEELVAVSARMSAEDFEIDPWRVDRGAVRRSVSRNVREGRAYVLREARTLVFKAEVAVRIPAGAQVEGVFTVEDRRGAGIASRCMAELGHRLLEEAPVVTLHASETNVSARRAYERAGYRRVDRFRLVIFAGS
jgi:ribosomal protein S18 acetylase RimI-like enzyme